MGFVYDPNGERNQIEIDPQPFQVVVPPAARRLVRLRAAGLWCACILSVFAAACSDDDGRKPLPSPTPSSTLAPTASASPTPTRTPMPSATDTAIPSDTPTASPTPSASPTFTPSPSVTPTSTPVDPLAACASLRGRSIGGAEIGSAMFVADTQSRPEYCRVSAAIQPQLNFEIRLPTDWNGRLLFTGGGGLNGFILPELILFNPSVGPAGYVTIATDSGHQGSPNDGSWALGDPLALENFAYLSTHTVLGAARQIVQERYGAPPDRSYFIGQSTGGREGLIEAQRWPDDFDGIVAFEPVYDMTALILAANRVAQRVFASPGGYLSAAEVAALARATLAACDDLDGIADGIISHVAACRFDPATLRCVAETDDECLTDAQIETVNAVRSPLELGFDLPNGVHSYPGWPLGHENGDGGWATWVTGSAASAPLSSLGFTLSDQTLRYLVIGDPAVETLMLSPAAYVEELSAFSALVDATDPDLSAFAERGGKLILWHGLSDYGVSAFSTIRYYDRVKATLGDEAVDDFLRFYTSPGVDHLNGGPGAATADFLGAVVAWVEEGDAPGELLAQKLVGSEVVLSRPLCRHPDYPRYVGSGDPADAASFRCTPAGLPETPAATSQSFLSR